MDTTEHAVENVRVIPREPLPFGRDVEVFYDGECPLCRREISMLRRWDTRHRIRFTDISSPDFSADSLGLTQPQLLAEIHGRLADGTIIKGVEVFRQLYQAVGFGWAVNVSRLPLIRQGLDLGYRVFARNRLHLTGRCDAGTCKLHEW